MSCQCYANEMPKIVNVVNNVQLSVDLPIFRFPQLFFDHFTPKMITMISLKENQAKQFYF